jgi:hypothetical protein
MIHILWRKQLIADRGIVLVEQPVKVLAHDYFSGWFAH